MSPFAALSHWTVLLDIAGLQLPFEAHVYDTHVLYANDFTNYLESSSVEQKNEKLCITKTVHQQMKDGKHDLNHAPNYVHRWPSCHHCARGLKRF
jgi:hypothetical protein